MKRVNFNQIPTPVARGSSRATCENSTKHMWKLVVTVVCSLWFLRPDCARSLLWCLCHLRSLYPALSSGVNHNATAKGWLLPSSSLADSQTWVSSTIRGRRLTFGDSLYYPIQWVEIKDGATWELLWGLGYSGSSLPSCPNLSLDNLLYREDFLWSAHRVGVT